MNLVRQAALIGWPGSAFPEHMGNELTQQLVKRYPGRANGMFLTQFYTKIT
jgi:hypothetical protein